MVQTAAKVFRKQSVLLVGMISQLLGVQMNYVVNGVMFVSVGADVNI